MGDGEKRSERRHYPRFRAGAYRVDFREFDAPSSQGSEPCRTGDALDISKGGMLFTTEEALTEGGWIQYHVHSPKGKKGREGMARVIRVGRDGERFLVAVEFLR